MPTVLNILTSSLHNGSFGGLWVRFFALFNRNSCPSITRKYVVLRFLVLSTYLHAHGPELTYIFTKALYIGKLSLPADVIEISWLFLFMVELMAQNTSKSISKIFLSLVFHDIKLKLVSNCFFVSIKRYTKEKLSLIKE